MAGFSLRWGGRARGIANEKREETCERGGLHHHGFIIGMLCLFCECVCMYTIQAEIGKVDEGIGGVCVYVLTGRW